MAGRYPKPDAEKVTRTPVQFAWVDLPERRDGPPPALPAWRVWQPSTVEWWTQLWTRPQATQWDPTGSTLHALAALYDDLFAARVLAQQVSAEIRQHEDRHGLNPKSMLQLRWRIGGPPAVAVAPAKSTRKTAAVRGAALRVVESA